MIGDWGSPARGPSREVIHRRGLVVGGHYVDCRAVARHGSEEVCHAVFPLWIEQKVDEAAKEVVFLLLDIDRFGAAFQVTPVLLKLGVVLETESAPVGF